MFIICMAWLAWHAPAFILDWSGNDGSASDNLRGLHLRNDVTPNLGGPFGGVADWIDYLALIGSPIFLIIGIKTIRKAPMDMKAGARSIALLSLSGA